MLLDLNFSTAFDTIDHSVFVQHLETWAHFKGAALQLQHSYLSDRISAVISNCSCSFQLWCFLRVHPWPTNSIYMLLLIIQSLCVSHHCYADDTHLYVTLQSSNSSMLDKCAKSYSLWSNRFALLDWWTSD